MERKGNNIAEDTFLYWLEVERYMTQFKEGNFENYDECLKVLRHLAVRELQMSIDKCNSQGVSIEIPSFLVNYSISSYEKIEKEAKLDEQNLCGGTNYYKSDYIKYSLWR